MFRPWYGGADSWGRKRWKTNGEKWWILVPIFFTVYKEFFTAYKGHKRWKEHLVTDMIFFTVSFHGLPLSKKRMGGGTRTRECALPKILGPLQKSFCSALSWIFVQEKQSTDTWGGGGGGKRTIPKTPFWEGCHSWGFPPPSFFPPPWRPLTCRKRAEYCFESTVSEEKTHWLLRQTRWVRICTQIILGIANGGVPGRGFFK